MELSESYSEGSDPTLPHLKLWAVVKEPYKDILSNGEEHWVLMVTATGPDNHDYVRDIYVSFFSQEEAIKIKREIDFANEPIIRNV